MFSVNATSNSLGHTVMAEIAISAEIVIQIADQRLERLSEVNKNDKFSVTLIYQFLSVPPISPYTQKIILNEWEQIKNLAHYSDTSRLHVPDKHNLTQKDLKRHSEN